ncbi:hypothetical protein B0T12DRAFT_400768 [Alternaria alternata]|nr:hypothetical protein B0T12DRAFT_400768 [Alternaria alternata]
MESEHEIVEAKGNSPKKEKRPKKHRKHTRDKRENEATEKGNKNSRTTQAIEDNAESRSSRNQDQNQSASVQKFESPHSVAAMVQKSTIPAAPKSLVSVTSKTDNLIDEASTQYRFEQSVHDEFYYTTMEQSISRYGELVGERTRKFFDDTAEGYRILMQDLLTMRGEHKDEMTAFRDISRDIKEKRTEKYKISSERDSSTRTEYSCLVLLYSKNSSSRLVVILRALNSILTAMVNGKSFRQTQETVSLPSDAMGNSVIIDLDVRSFPGRHVFLGTGNVTGQDILAVKAKKLGWHKHPQQSQ